MSLQTFVGTAGRSPIGAPPGPQPKHALRRRPASPLHVGRNPSALRLVEGHSLDCRPSGHASLESGRIDHAAMLAHAEEEDLALVKIAAAKLAAALREVHLLLGRGHGAEWKREALARCAAKGWIAIQGDPSADVQTYQVTPVGYRSAGLRIPLFLS